MDLRAKKLINIKIVGACMLLSTNICFAQSDLTIGIANNLDYIGNNNPNAAMANLVNAIQALNASQVDGALKQLAPLTTAPIYNAHVEKQSIKQIELRLASLRNQSSSYIAGDDTSENSLWFMPYGNKATQNPIKNSSGYNAKTGGIAIGFDKDVNERYNLGMAASYALSRVNDLVSTNSNTRLKTYMAIFYGAYNFSTTQYLDWMTGVSATNYIGNRVISFTGYNQTAASDYSSQQFIAKGIFGKNYSAFDFVQFNPEFSLQYSFAKQYDYTETNANGAILNVVRKSANTLQLGLGSKISTPIMFGPSIFVPELHFMAFYNPINGQQDSIFAFTNASTNPMISTLKQGRSALRLGTSITLAAIGSMEIKLNYDYEIQDRYRDHSGYINVKYRF